MRRGIGKFAGAALVAAGVLTAGALANPTCVNTNDLGPDGDGFVLKSWITSGYCVLAKDKLYGNFDLAGLPAATVLFFNNNTVGGETRYQLSFGATYKSGTTYSWGYEVAVQDTTKVIVSLDSDFDQANGTSTLDKTTNPTTATPIHIVKIGTAVQAGSTTMTTFGTGISDLIITETLVDNGSIGSVTNTVVQADAPSNIPSPEPATLALLGAGLAGVSFARRKRRN